VTLRFTMKNKILNSFIGAAVVMLYVILCFLIGYFARAILENF